MENTDVKKEQARPDAGRVFFKNITSKLPSLKTHIMFWVIAVSGLFLDLATKKEVFDYINENGPVTLIKGFLSFIMVTNEGAAFGLFAGKAVFLISISFVALFVISVFFLFGGTKSVLVNISLGLLAGSICGNLYDRLFNDGMVRDFIDVVIAPGRHWPTFNIADSMLCIGVVLMLIATCITDRPCQKHAQQQK